MSPGETTQDGKLTSRRAILASSGATKTRRVHNSTVDRTFRKNMTTRLKLARVLMEECQRILADPACASELIPLSPSPHVVSRKLRNRVTETKPIRGDPITDEWSKSLGLTKKRQDCFTNYRVKVEKQSRERREVLTSIIAEQRQTNEQMKQNYAFIAQDTARVRSNMQKDIERWNKRVLELTETNHRLSKDLFERTEMYEKRSREQQDMIMDLQHQIMNTNIGHGGEDRQDCERQASRRSSLASTFSKFKTFGRSKKRQKADEDDAESLASSISRVSVCSSSKHHSFAPFH